MSAAATISVIIPTLNAAGRIDLLLAALQNQTRPPDEIILVDSGSRDATVELARSYRCQFCRIAPEAFTHGKARNLGARAAAGDILVFMTQDAMPVQADFLAKLIAPLAGDDPAAAAYARQLAKKEASPLEEFDRLFNYPDSCMRKTLADLPQLGIKTFFFSNVASACRRSEFEAMNGFSEDVVVNEDMEFCIRSLQAGKSVAYAADAVVRHSHGYTWTELFQRYFDIGYFFLQAKPLLNGCKPAGEGLKYLKGQLGFVWNRKSFELLPSVFNRATAKWLGFHCGRLAPWLPNRWVRRFSGQTYYWLKHPVRPGT